MPERSCRHDQQTQTINYVEAECELLRRAYGESLVEEALRLADEAAPQASRRPQELPPEGDKRASEIAEALDRMMDRR